MAGVVKWQIIRPLATNAHARAAGFHTNQTARMNLPGRVAQLRLSQFKQPKFPSLRVFAKGNVRHKEKVPNSPDKATQLPPRTISAPSLTEFDTQEPLVDESISRPEREKTTSALNPPVLSWDVFPRMGRQILRRLSSLKLAVAELFLIAALSALGTILEQNESPQFYFDSYPEDHPMFGFLTWRVILDGSLNHIYTSWYYLGLLLLLALSLAACSTTRQFPMVKVARRWSFLKSKTAFSKLPFSETLEKAKLGDFATLLMAEGFEVFARGPALYAFKGLAGRYAPIGVHIALLLIMGGATLSAVGGYHGSVMVPQGLGFQLGDVLAPQGFLSIPSPVLNSQLQLNKFFIDYLDTGAVAQFHSDLSVVDTQNKEVYRKTIAVNDPLRYGGVTIYQTDWAISAVQVRVDGSDPYNLVMAALKKGDKKLFGTFLPLADEGLQNAKGISILARDLQSVVIYDQEGKFVGVRRPGSDKPISVDGVSILVEDLIGSSGLELKMDAGVPVVYTGFGALMLTTCISYLSHSQIWALQDGSSLLVGGKSNRAKVEFEIDLNKILDVVPEINILSGPEQIRVNGGSSRSTTSSSRGIEELQI